MPEGIPRKLNKEPLVESLWEVRFSSEMKAISNVLPGLIFPVLKLPGIEQLPAAHIPAEIRETDVNLIYAHTVRLFGGPFAVQVGDRSVLLSCSRPYCGWTKFSEKIRELSGLIRNTELQIKPDRFSLKYVNILSFEADKLSDTLNVSVDMAGKTVTDCPLLLRVERTHDAVVNISRIASPARATTKDGEVFSGILVENDTIFTGQGVLSWEELEQHLKSMHDVNKAGFFDLLKEPALRSLGPVY